MRSTVRLTSISRASIPAPIRNELDIDSGDTIEVMISSLGDNIRIPITAKVYTNGRITVPVRVQEALEVDEGDLIEIDVGV